MLLDLKHRGLTIDAKVAVGDGALDFLGCTSQDRARNTRATLLGSQESQRLEQNARSVQAKAKGDLHEIWQAEMKADPEKAFDAFCEQYQAKYSQACDSLTKDRSVLLTFYDFSTEHWSHLRTTNPIESTFATIRLRHRKTRGSGSRPAIWR